MYHLRPEREMYRKKKNKYLICDIKPSLSTVEDKKRLVMT
jgi:hypothetical protein